MNGMCNSNYILLLNTVVVTENWHAVERMYLYSEMPVSLLLVIKWQNFKGLPQLSTHFLNAFVAVLYLIVPFINLLQM
jgi:hypothetical protein